MADYPGQPAKVPHIRMQLALDAEEQHQNITDNNNEVLNVAYSASPNVAPDISEEDVMAFMESDIVQQLMQDPAGTEGMIGVQYAAWQHPYSELEIIANGDLVVSENEPLGIDYSVGLFEQPEMPVTVMVLADSDRVDLGMGPGEPVMLHFDPGNWLEPQQVFVIPIDDSFPNGETPIRTSHEIIGDTGLEYPRGVPLEIILMDDETCETVLEGDINHDLCVNMLDLAILAQDWLDCCVPSYPAD